MNHDAGCGIKIPVNFKFLGPAKAIQWAESAVKKLFKYRPESKTLEKVIFPRKYMSFNVKIVFVPVSAL